MPSHAGLTTPQISNIIEAASHAFCSGMPLNIYITINLEMAQIDSRPQTAIGLYIKAIGDWLSQYRVRRYYVWFIERQRGSDPHVHVLLHVPCDLWRSFRKASRHREWLKAIGARPAAWRTVSGRVIKFKRLTGAKPTDPRIDEIYNLARVVCYLCKGLDEDASREFGIAREDQGVVQGKRLGISESLMPNARAKYIALNDAAERGSTDDDRYHFYRHLLSICSFSVEEMRWAASEGMTDAFNQLFGAGRENPRS